jgi:hypothetical protein
MHVMLRESELRNKDALNYFINPCFYNAKIYEYMSLITVFDMQGGGGKNRSDRKVDNIIAQLELTGPKSQSILPS